MNSASIIRTAALILGFAGFAATASAQSFEVTVGQEMLALARVEAPADANAVASRAYVEEVAIAAASVSGVEADATIRQAVELRIAEGTPDAKVVRSVLTGDRWIVRMNEIGVPKSEYRRGLVVYAVLGEEVVVQQMVVERPYFATSDVDSYSVKLGPVR